MAAPNTYSASVHNRFPGSALRSDAFAHALYERGPNSNHAMEAIMMPYRVVGLELIAGGVARSISCGRRHTAVVLSGPQPSCTRDCCCACECNYQQ